MSEYRVVFEDPKFPEEPVKILCPAPEWMETAMNGELPSVEVYWKLQDAEEAAISSGKHQNFCHNERDWMEQFTAPRIGKLSEEQAIEYLIMKDIPKRVWSIEYNRPMFKIVKEKEISSDRTFRNAWRITT